MKIGVSRYLILLLQIIFTNSADIFLTLTDTPNNRAVFVNDNSTSAFAEDSDMPNSTSVFTEDSDMPNSTSAFTEDSDMPNSKDALQNGSSFTKTTNAVTAHTSIGFSNNSVGPFKWTCVAKDVRGGQVLTETPLGELLPEEVAALQTGRTLTRTSRLMRKNTQAPANPRGRGSALVLAALCQVCKVRRRRRCLQRYCSVTRRTRRMELRVDCLPLDTAHA